MQATTLVQGLVITLADRYDGNGLYKHDNGAGEALRLLRPMSDGNDWYVSRDLTGPIETAQWDYIVHVSRLTRSEVVGFCLNAAREAAAQRRWERYNQAQREAIGEAPAYLETEGEHASRNWLNEPQSDAEGNL